ncbi:hypothetical protein ABAC460_09955 [Asticcacaulis sp. AC460]|uniref:tail fiber protein n=1 Tax=Asticcacaulis sp. AC460 TaxID=1282360 RepID=UPI0003C3C81B|nr:tail fiber protein [Asticcacaulis sp. AC460]ESQ90082.1 hypothetical protein ABAC460_09955 [Asticcacaulis sp. AC460]
MRSYTSIDTSGLLSGTSLATTPAADSQWQEIETSAPVARAAVTEYVPADAATTAAPAEAPAAIVGALTSPSNYQAGLVLNQSVVALGAFSYTNGMFYIAAVRTFAGNFTMADAYAANGALLTYQQNQILGIMLNNAYGGDWSNNFNLPNLIGRTVTGSDGYYGWQYGSASMGTLYKLDNYVSQGAPRLQADNYEPSLVMHYGINVAGLDPSQENFPATAEVTGAVRPFAGFALPDGWMKCYGQVLNIADYAALYAVLGTRYGGNGVTTFALPDLRGRTVVGAGNGVAVGTVMGSSNVVITNANLPVAMGGGGEGFDNRQPSLALQYLIAVHGDFPVRNGVALGEYLALGEIVAFAGNSVPSGFLPCDGRLLPIAQNTALFSILGTTYGGNGTTNFALPNLVGRNIVGAGTGFNVGQLVGSNTTTLALSDIPGLNFSGFYNDNALYGGDNNDTINGWEGQDALTGNNGNDSLIGSAGHDTLDGGLGDDTLTGGEGDDVFIIDTVSDLIQEAAGEGNDTVRTSLTWTLQNDVENLVLTGSASVNGTGNAANNALTGNSGNNVLEGGTGNDTLDGGGGTDTLKGGEGDDVFVVDTASDVLEDSGGNDTIRSSLTWVLQNGYENLVLTGSGHINGTGTALNNTLTGNLGNNVLDGGAGNDTLSGGAGDDTYYVDAAGDQVIEASGAGRDSVIASVTYSLAGQSAENLTLTGSAHLNATGNDLDNALTGNSGNNVLDGGAGNDVLTGGAGNDTMTGGAGDDTFYVDAAGDKVIEASGQGRDTVIAGVSFSLAGQVIENLILTGTGHLNGTGNGVGNALTGNSGNNVLDGGLGSDSLDGGAGNDTLKGGAGDDTFVVDSLADVVEEADGGGIDTIQSSLSWTLGAAFENLTLTGTANISGTGNDLNNVISGNGGANTLSGGAGDDTYYVDNIGDKVLEQSGKGKDLIYASVSYSLAGQVVENLILTGGANINATGNSLGNSLTGNSGGNVLDGGAGADTLAGGLGDDTYVVDNTGDKVIEASGEGNDLILSSVTYSLNGRTVEALTLTGTAHIDATGNSLANSLFGNGGNNVLDGGAGNDSLDGGVGNDTLRGGSGNDTFVIDSALDVIEDSGGVELVRASFSYGLAAGLENLVLTGTAAIIGTGNALNNSLTGNSAGNILDGGAGNDTLAGGLGDDTYYVDSTGDKVIEAAGEGRDEVRASVSYSLAGQVIEALVLTGAANLSGTGNGVNNLIVGNDGHNVLDGGAGNDTLQGGAGDDTYYVQSSGDVIIDTSGFNRVFASVSHSLTAGFTGQLTLTGTSDINATGSEVSNILTGNTGNNRLDGGGGVDIMEGGGGNDTFVVNSVNDTITGGGDGGDLIEAAVSFSLSPAYLAALRLIGAGNIDATGNHFDNALTGNAGNNRLDGGAGNDTLEGGAGADSFYVDSAFDQIVDGSPDDQIFASVSWTLQGGSAFALHLTGSGDLSATGNGLANLLTGNAGNNVLDGGLGPDTLMGGDGNDTYHVDPWEDVVSDSYGDNLILASGTISLGNDFAGGVTLQEGGYYNATGNAWNNYLTGNTGNNLLDGGMGEDTLAGGGGSDTYFIDSAFDIIVGGDGDDHVFAAVSYSLEPDSIGNLTLIGWDGLSATGNGSNNTLNGNLGNNLLNGKGGDDLLTGGLGADTFQFELDWGWNTITDLHGFENDMIDVSAITHGTVATDAVLQNGGDINIQLGATTIIVLNASVGDVLAHMIW